MGAGGGPHRGEQWGGNWDNSTRTTIKKKEIKIKATIKKDQSEIKNTALPGVAQCVECGL